MGMTIEEAKTKWCPAVQVLIGPHNQQWQNEAFTNRMYSAEGWKDTNCLANGCMAWVWEDTDKNLGRCGMVK